jgi:transcription antitermination protein NusB
VPARSKARKRALDILFEAEQRDTPVLDLLAERSALASPPVSAYAAGLVRGVTGHAARIDQLISEFAEGWTLDRMPAVDRNVLRIGVYELLWAPDVPDGVAISEAVLLARDLSTDASPAFVNGLLARIAELKPSLQVLHPSAPQQFRYSHASHLRGASDRRGGSGQLGCITSAQCPHTDAILARQFWGFTWDFARSGGDAGIGLAVVVEICVCWPFEPRGGGRGRLLPL